MGKALDSLFEVVEKLFVALWMPDFRYFEDVVVEQLILDVLALVVEHAR